MATQHSPGNTPGPSKTEAAGAKTSLFDTQEISPRTASAAYEDAEIHAAKLIRLPPFWKDNPALWFMQVEASFALSRITSDDSKYRYVLVNLDISVLPFVSDIVASPPATGKYETLKRRITDSFDETNETKLRRLLRGHELAEEKPSNLLQRLRNLAGGQCNDMVLRTLFLEQLPDTVRSILAISEVVDLSKLALQADKILEMSKANVNQVCVNTGEHSVAQANNVQTEISELKVMVEALTEQVKGLQVGQRRNRSKSRGRYDKRRHTPVPDKSRQEDTGVCFFHRKFGKEAYRCLLPCKWNNNQPEN